MNPQLQDRYEGALLGSAVGDALGSNFISWHFVSPESFLAATANKPLHPTVATDYLMQAAATFLELDDRPFTSMLDHFRGTRETPNVTTLLQATRRGTRLSHNSADFSSRIGIPRDLAAVLSVPAMLLAGTSTEAGENVIDGLNDLLEQLDRRGPSLVFAGILHDVLTERVDAPLDIQTLEASVGRHVPADLSAGTMALVTRLTEASSRIDVMNRLKASQPSNAVPTALWAVSNSPQSYAGCVYAALSIGQDTNASAMLAGAISGVLLGADNIPIEWVNRLSPEIASRLRKIAQDLYRCAAAEREYEVKSESDSSGV